MDAFCLHLVAGRGRDRKTRHLYQIFSPSGHVIATVTTASRVADVARSLGYDHCQGLTSGYRITLDEYRRTILRADAANSLHGYA